MIEVFVMIISYKKGAPWPWIKFSLKTLELKITTYKSLIINWILFWTFTPGLLLLKDKTVFQS